jgi:hypothetical protein
VFRCNPHHWPLPALAPGLGLKPDSGAICESAEVAEVEVDVVGDEDEDGRMGMMNVWTCMFDDCSCLCS